MSKFNTANTAWITVKHQADKGISRKWFTLTEKEL